MKIDGWRLGCTLVVAWLAVRVDSALAEDASPQSRDIRRVVEAALRSSRIPGASVAVVTETGVVTVTHGLRSLESRAPVSVRTKFPIGSVTKSFTAAAVAVLVDRKQIRWDDKVQGTLKEWAAPSFLVRPITIRDLLAHRVPVERGDALWQICGATPNQILGKYRLLGPASTKTGFYYSNLNYLVADRIIHAAAKRPLAEFISAEITGPLGMRDTVPTYASAKLMSNVATAYIFEGGAYRAVTETRLDRVAAAGAMYSSASDMATWMRVQISGGRLGELKLWTPEAGAEMHRLQCRGLGEEFGPGLGWMVDRHDEHRIVKHGGNTLGSSAFVVCAPDAACGVAVLSNLANTRVPRALAYDLLDVVLGAKSKSRAIRWARVEADNSARFEFLGPSPLPTKRYVGVFRSQKFGQVRTWMCGDELCYRLPDGDEGRLKHLSHTAFFVPGRWPRLGFLFGLNMAGKVVRLAIEIPGGACAMFERDLAIELAELRKRRGDRGK